MTVSRTEVAGRAACGLGGRHLQPDAGYPRVRAKRPFSGSAGCFACPSARGRAGICRAVRGRSPKFSLFFLRSLHRGNAVSYSREESEREFGLQPFSRWMYLTDCNRRGDGDASILSSRGCIRSGLTPSAIILPRCRGSVPLRFTSAPESAAHQVERFSDFSDFNKLGIFPCVDRDPRDKQAARPVHSRPWSGNRS